MHGDRMSHLYRNLFAPCRSPLTSLMAVNKVKRKLSLHLDASVSSVYVNLLVSLQNEIAALTDLISGSNCSLGPHDSLPVLRSYSCVSPS